MRSDAIYKICLQGERNVYLSWLKMNPSTNSLNPAALEGLNAETEAETLKSITSINLDLCLCRYLRWKHLPKTKD